MVSADPFDFEVTVPADWIAHDPDPATRRASIETAVDELLAGQPQLGPAREGVIERMLGFAVLADESFAMAAATWWTVIEGVELAANMMVVAISRRKPGDDDEELAALELELSTEDDGDLEPRRVARVDLGGFPAVRLEVVAESPAEPGEAAAVVLVVQYWLPVPEAAHTLLFSCSTPCLAVRDQIVAVFDTMAGTLRPAA